MPEELAGLTALQHLDCSYTQLRDLSPLKDLVALQELNCSYTQVSDLSPLKDLVALRHLICSGTQVSDLSPLKDLVALQELDCANTQVSDLAPLKDLVALQYLICIFARVSDLTPLNYLVALRYLNCVGTQVSDLSPLKDLVALQELDCSYTQVSDLAPLKDLTALQHLDCAYTRVSDLAPLKDLVALQHLSCTRTQVSDLAPLKDLVALQHLSCTRTQVSDLAPLKDLVALQHLDCTNTQVSDLSPLKDLVALQLLNCSRCRLRALPTFIRNRDLELVAFNTHIPGLPYGVLSESEQDDCLARVRAHFADMAKEAADLTDIKVLLLGNGGVGKTQIARWLSGAPFNPEWDSTHGIQIFAQPEPESIAARLRLQMWDFGGQEIYHGTHAMFLRGPAVLMPVWAKDRENRDGDLTFRNYPLSYWIDVAMHQASPESPVLIIQNKCDRKEDEEPRFPVSEETLNELQYVTELRVSPKERRGRAMLEETLQDAIAWMRDPKRLGLPQIGAGRLRVQQRLEAMREADIAVPREHRRHRLLGQRDFDAICAEEGISSPAALLAYLHANGTVFYRPGLFADRIVLDQGWALEAIYAVFDRRRVYDVLRQDGGRFSRAKLGLLIWQDHSDSEQKLLLSMMVSCGICFVHRSFGDFDDDNTEYIAPDLLPSRERVTGQLAARWTEGRPGESATFRYALLHGGLIRSILARIGEIAGPDALYWRGGVCAFEGTTRSRMLIEEEMTGDWQGAIHVRTQDGHAAVLLEKAVALIERVQTRLAMQPIAVERSSPSVELHDPRGMSIQQEKSVVPEWYVSYAWGDDRTPEGQAREEIVDRLCEVAKAQGHTILRDKEVLSLGDSISGFMRRIGTGDRVFVILSDKYLRSPHCMFELSEVWRTSRQEGKAFLERVRIYALPDANIFKPTDGADWAIHWKKEHDALESRAHEHGTVVLGELGNRRLTQMHKFYTQVSDILGTLADVVQPRTFEELERYGFNDPPAS